MKSELHDKPRIRLYEIHSVLSQISGDSKFTILTLIKVINYSFRQEYCEAVQFKFWSLYLYFHLLWKNNFIQLYSHLSYWGWPQKDCIFYKAELLADFHYIILLIFPEIEGFKHKFQRYSSNYSIFRTYNKF